MCVVLTRSWTQRTMQTGRCCCVRCAQVGVGCLGWAHGTGLASVCNLSGRDTLQGIRNSEQNAIYHPMTLVVQTPPHSQITELQAQLASMRQAAAKGGWVHVSGWHPVCHVPLPHKPTCPRAGTGWVLPLLPCALAHEHTGFAHSAPSHTSHNSHNSHTFPPALLTSADTDEADARLLALRSSVDEELEGAMERCVAASPARCRHGVPCCLPCPAKP